MDESERRRRDARCSFCGSRQDQVRRLVVGPAVYICDRCIRLCNEILDEDAGAGAAGGRCEGKPRRGGWRRSLTWRPWKAVIGR